ncbi:MAG: META domain-containing protein [Gelidibacter sp.]
MRNILSLSLLICTILFSCKSQDVSKKSSNKAETALIGSKWILTKLNGDPVNLTSDELQQPFIKLTETDHGVGGNGGCNSFGGSYTLTDTQTISFSQMISTMRYCDDHGIEGVFMGNLQKASTFVIVNNELTLKDENGYVLATFEANNEKTK